jgi:hypothetical protein
MNYFLLLNRHKNIELKRKRDYKKNLIIAVVSIFSLILLLSLLLLPLSKEDIESWAVFVLPVIIILDFSLRFFLKKNPCAAIFPYLTLPIPRKTLILYIVLSDLQRFWIWGSWLVYCGILLFFGILTFSAAIILLLLVLLNNYLTAFVKALTGGYAILIFPVCMVLICLILLVVSLLYPIFSIIIAACIVFFLLAALYFTLKEYLYKELNRFAV